MGRGRGLVRFSWVFAVLASLPTSVLPVSAQIPAQTSGRGRRFSISGTLRDFQSSYAIDGAKVDLRAVTGSVVSTVFTNSNGTFQFDGIGTGNYSLVFTQVGYDQLDQDVTVQSGPIMGLQLELRRAGDPTANNSKGPGKISARELAIPSKAQDAMQKGMRLLYEKSDYSRAIAEFQRALKAYPDYFEAEMQMGMAYMRLGDTSGAEQVLHKSLAMNEPAIRRRLRCARAASLRRKAL
jgi:tetratricopeptide (TPR) repeat protein